MTQSNFGLKIVVLPDVKPSGRNISLAPGLPDPGDQVRTIRRALRNSGLNGNNTIVPGRDNSFMANLQDVIQGSIGVPSAINVHATSSITCNNCQAEFIITKKPKRGFLFTAVISCPFCGTKHPYK